ncbi:hypothetical protein ACFC6U_38655, partial [Kitasatospora purpeofusca]|uniref:hypothetical protein n=1 Tax=Kitasatospora purpeofusca TaxID=67352 RepID=UPI0035E1FCE6
ALGAGSRAPPPTRPPAGGPTAAGAPPGPRGAEAPPAAGGVGPADGGEGPERAGSGADQAGDQEGGRRSARRETGAAGASVPAPAQPGGRTSAPAPRQHAGAVEDQTGAAGRPRPRGRAPRRPSGRERHDEKITVYVSAEELMDLEHTRLVLRGEHGLAVDRGRIVREAIAVVLADLEQRGEASILVRRLRGR